MTYYISRDLYLKNKLTFQTFCSFGELLIDNIAYSMFLIPYKSLNFP